MPRSRFVLAASCAALLAGAAHQTSAQSPFTWTGAGATGSWLDPLNWGGAAPDGNDLLNFAGSTSLNTINDLTGAALNQHRIVFNASAGAFTLGGAALTLADFVGAAPRIENNSINLQTINLNLTLNGSASGNATEISPTDGSLLFGGTVDLAGTTQLRILGNNGHTVTFNGAITSTGGANSVALNGNSIAIFGSANTYSGDTLVNAGTLRFVTGGSADASTIRLGDTLGTAPATVELAGGNTLASSLVVRAGSAGSKVINATNGVNAINGSVVLDDDLTVSVATGSLTFGGAAFDLKNQTLTVAGDASIAGALQNSVGSGKLNKLGIGTLTLGAGAADAVANTFTGLTTISGGTVLLNKAAGTNAIGGDVLIGGGVLSLTGFNQIADTSNITVSAGGITWLNAEETVASITATGGSLNNGNNNGGIITVTGALTTSGATVFGLNSAGQWSAETMNLGSSSAVGLGGNNVRLTTLTVGNGGLNLSGQTITLNTVGPGVAGSKILFSSPTAQLTSTGTSAINVTTAANARDLELGGVNRTINVTSGTLAVGAIVTDGASTAGIIKEGIGTLTLTNTANSFTGDITINGGVLAYTGQGNADPTVLGAGPKTITLNNNAVLRPTTASDPNLAGQKIFSIGATGGTFDTPAGITFSLNDGTFNGSTVNQFQGTGTLTKTGAGNFQVGQASGGYPLRTGDTIINAGAILVGNTTALGTTTNVTLNGTGAAIGAVNSGVTIPYPITAAVAGGILMGQAGNSNFTGLITLSTDTTLATGDYATAATARTNLISGQVTGAGNITVTGPTGATRGVFSFNNTLNDFTGTITVGNSATVENLARFSGPNGTLPASSGKTINNAAIIFAALGTGTASPQLDLRDNGNGTSGQVFSYGNTLTAIANGGNIAVGNNTFGGAPATQGKFQLSTLALGAQTLSVSGAAGYSLEFTGATTLSGNATISPTTADLTLTGDVTGNFSLTKTGAGVLNLPGAKTFGGLGRALTVSAGLIGANGDSSLGDAANTITLSGGGIRANASFTTARLLTLSGAPVTTVANGTLDAPAGITLSLGTFVNAVNGAIFGKTGLGNVASSITSGSPFGDGNVTLSAGGLVLQPSGTGADVSLIGAASGTVSRLTITGGAGYTAAPTVTFSAPGSGITATATATLNGAVVNAVNLTNGGAGYVAGAVPTVTLTGGGFTTAATATVAALNFFSFDKAASLRLNKGGNNSLTYTVGTANAPTNTVLNRLAVGSSFALIPTALANLGATTAAGGERFIVLGGVNKTNNTVSPSILAVASPADSSATFLDYDAVNGFLPAVYNADINAAGTTENADVATDLALSFGKTVNALRVGSGATLSGPAGTTLTLGAIINPSFTGNHSGIILNGGAITLPTITPGGEMIVYTSAAGGSISSAFTSASAFTKFGPGLLTLTGVLPTGALHVTEGALKLAAPNLTAAGAALNLNSAAVVFDLGGFNQSVASINAAVGSVITNNGAAATLTTSPTAANTFNGFLNNGTGALSLVKNGAQTLTLAAVNNYSGGTTINAGQITVPATGTIGTGSVAVNGSGRLQLDTAATINSAGGATITLTPNLGSVAQPVFVLRHAAPPTLLGTGGIIALDSGLMNNYNLPNLLAGTPFFLGANSATTFSGPVLNIGLGNTYRLGGGGNTLTLSAANIVTGANDLLVGSVPLLGVQPANSGGAVTLSSAQDFTGATTINNGLTLTLIGQNIAGGSGGSALGSTGFAVNYGTFILNSDVGTNTANGQNNNRIADTAPVTLNQSTLRLTVANITAGGTTSETFSQLNYSKGSTVSFTRGTGSTVSGVMNVDTLSARPAGATLTFTTQVAGELGGAGASAARFFVNAAPALTNNIVAPYFIDQTANTFLTYGGTGFADAPFTQTLLDAALSTDIVDQSSALALTTNPSAYAVRLGTGAVTGNTITIGSGGLILNNSATGVNHSANLVFGDPAAPGEALLFVNNTATTVAGATQTVLSGLLTASSITKFGPGSVRLVNTGNLTNAGLTNAVITVNAGALEFGDRATTNDQLAPPPSVSVVMNGGSINFFQTTTISGLSGTGGTVRVGANTSGSTAKAITINTQVDQTFSGTVTSDDDNASDLLITKGGRGKLTLSGTVQLSRTALVNFGELIFAGNATINSGVANNNDRQRLIVNQGGAFTADNTVINNNDRLLLVSGTTNGGGYFQLSGGTFNFLGSSLVDSIETFGNPATLAANNEPFFGAGLDLMNIVPGNGRAAILTSERNINRNAGGTVLFKGANFGGTRGAADTATFAYNTSGPTLTGGGGATGTPTVGVIRGMFVDAILGVLENFGIATYDNGPNGTLGGGDDIGVRRLAAAEMTNLLTSGDATLNNVRLSSAITGIDLLTTINSLSLAGGASMAGTGTLSLNSATLLSANNGAVGANSIGVATLDFGFNEGTLFIASPLGIGSVVTGFAGLTVGGTGAVLTLGNAANSFSGGAGLTLNGATVAVAADGALGDFSNTVRLNNGGTLRATTGFTSARPIVLGNAGGVVDIPSATETLTLSGLISGNLGAVNANSGNAANTGSKPIDTIVLTKSGPGTLLLTSEETFIGRTEVNGGKLLVGDGVSGSLPANSHVAVNNGGTLGGLGTIGGSVSVNTGGTLAPGLSAGLLNTGDLGYASGSHFALELNSTLPGTGYDQVNVTGGINLTGGDIQITLGFSPTNDVDVFFVLLNDGADAITGTFAGLAQGAQFDSGGRKFQISYTADSFAATPLDGFNSVAGNDVAILAVVPEPGAAVSLLGGFGTLLGLQRFRRRGR